MLSVVRPVMGETDLDPVKVPREVYDQLETFRERSTHNPYTDVYLGLSYHGFDDALNWLIKNPEKYVEAEFGAGWEPVE